MCFFSSCHTGTIGEENNGVKLDRQSLASYGIILTISRKSTKNVLSGMDGRGREVRENESLLYFLLILGCILFCKPV